jgi:drug/metabolite transporter (DMT)-like permease
MHAMDTSARSPAIIAAYACLYVVWGTTYLAIAFAIETLPPFTSGGLRFALAAVLMGAWLALRAPEQLRGLPWKHALLSGALLGGIGNGFVVWAQQGLPSGIAAMVVTSIPVNVVLLDWLFFSRKAPSRRSLAGIGIALAGVLTIVLARHGIDGEASPIYLGAILCATVAWSIGTLLQKRGTPPTRLLGVTFAQMLSAAGLQLGLGLATGEWAAFEPGSVSAASWIAVVYLALFGSIIALNCYVWLLTREPASKVATYALVNPIVAVVLGALVLGERLTPVILLGAGLTLGGVALVLFGSARPFAFLAMRRRRPVPAAAAQPAPCDGC